MNQRLGLFASQAAARLMARRAPSRKLYTDPIYPYPFKYFNEYKYQRSEMYRENFYLLPQWPGLTRYGIWMQRFLWTWIFWHSFHDPGAIFGHTTFPDPTLWTDEELGIPPLDSESYKEWTERKIADIE